MRLRKSICAGGIRAVFAPARTRGISDNSNMSSIDIALLKRLARSAVAAGDHYAFCRTLPCIAATAEDLAAWSGDYLRALSRLGLGKAANEVLEHYLKANMDSTEFRTLHDALAKLPAGRIEWKSRQPRFRANLRALSARNPAAATLVEQSSGSLSQYEIHQCADGNYQVRSAAENWRNEWLPCLDDHQSGAPSRIQPNPPGTIPVALIFDGLGLGWELLNGYERTGKGFLGAKGAIYCIERNPLFLAILFHLHDLRMPLSDERVCWFIGPDALSQFQTWLESDSTWPLSDRLCRAPLAEYGNSTESVASVLNSILEGRQSRLVDLSTQIDSRYRDRDAAWWARRFAEGIDENGRATGRPLRILGITSIHTSFLQYSMRDCLWALEQLGHQTRLVIEPVAHRSADLCTALKTQLDFEPDLVLVLSRMRDEMGGFVHGFIPTVAWDQDALPWVLDPNRKPALAWNDFFMGVTAFGARRRFGWPAHRCEYCSIAGSPDTYSAEPLPADMLAPYRAGISYVSHASATPEAMLAELAHWIPQDHLRSIFQAALNRLMPAWLSGGPHPGPIMTAIFDAAAECGMSQLSRDDLNRIAQPLHRIGDRVFRHMALEWIADWADRTGRRLALWGNGWEMHPRFAKYARGPSRNGEELRRIYQASTINLQLMQMGFFHQRALDGLMAGGFFLGRRSDADESGPMLRKLVGLLEQNRISSFGDVASLKDDSARYQVEQAMRRCGEDPRMLSAEYIENRRLTAEADFVDERIENFGDILFSTREEFEERAERYLNDESARRTWATRMRDVLIRDYSYQARMARMLIFVRDGFRVDSADGSSPRTFCAAPQLAGEPREHRLSFQR